MVEQYATTLAEVVVHEHARRAGDDQPPLGVDGEDHRHGDVGKGFTVVTPDLITRLANVPCCGATRHLVTSVLPP
jgi:hypothetical protein